MTVDIVSPAGEELISGPAPGPPVGIGGGLRSFYPYSKFREDIAAVANSTLPVDELKKNIEKIVRRAAADRSCSIIVSSATSDLAIRLLDRLQEWMDLVGQNHPFHRSAIYLLLSLAKTSEQVPASLLIQLDKKPRAVPDKNGGYAKIFYGRFKREKVVIKYPIDNTTTADDEDSSDSDKSADDPNEDKADGKNQDQIDEGGKEPVNDATDTEAAMEPAEKRQAFITEALLWRQLKHNHVLKFYGLDKDHYEKTGDVGLVSPRMSQGTLYHYVNDKRYNPRVSREKLPREIASGLAYLHSHKVVHGDISSTNILIDENHHAVIADFGLATIGHKTRERPSTRESHGATPGWAAPEYHNSTTRPEPSVDVWAFGVACYFICTATIPRKGNQHEQFFADSFTPLLNEVIDACKAENPQERPSMAAILSILTSNEEEAGRSKRNVLFRATARHDYKAKRPDEVSFFKGDILEIKSINGNYWQVAEADSAPNKVVSADSLETGMFKAKALIDSQIQSPSSQSKGKLEFSKDEILKIIAVHWSSWLAMNSNNVVGIVHPDAFTMDDDDVFDKKDAREARAFFTFEAPEQMYKAWSFKRGDPFNVANWRSDWCLARRPGERKVQIIRSMYLCLGDKAGDENKSSSAN